MWLVIGSATDQTNINSEPNILPEELTIATLRRQCVAHAPSRSAVRGAPTAFTYIYIYIHIYSTTHPPSELEWRVLGSLPIQVEPPR